MSENNTNIEQKNKSHASSFNGSLYEEKSKSNKSGSKQQSLKASQHNEVKNSKISSSNKLSFYNFIYDYNNSDYINYLLKQSFFA